LRSRNGSLTFLTSILILILAAMKASAQPPLYITFTVSPLSGNAPFTPSYQFSYNGAYKPVRIIIYWGDGSSDDVSSCSESCPVHTYTLAGTYAISISITDSAGRTATDSKTITAYSVPQTQYSLQVGALGDSASIGNTGVGAEIRTHIYDVVSPDLGDSFWVGDNLQNGAFIQFGYELFSPGNYCLYGETTGVNINCLGTSDTISNGDARWFWQYWPDANVTDFYSGIGPANSAGPEGYWHVYQIWPNVAHGWDFVLDGQVVWSFNLYQVTESKDPAVVVAEEVTGTPSASGTLGPVEFRNLTYWTTYGWRQVTSLTAISACGILNPNCGIDIPYGVTAFGPNHIIAGEGEQPRTQGEAVWTEQVFLTIISPFATSGEGSYDVGTTANFSTNPIYAANSGVAVFVGWYDENGNLMTTSDTGSIRMNEPHSITAHWLTFTYTSFSSLCLVIALLSAIFIVRKVPRKNVRRGEFVWCH